MADTGKITYRISTVQACFVIATCVIADGLQILLDVTGVLAVAADIVTATVEFYVSMWFWWHGVTYTSGTKATSKFLTMFGMSIIEFIPIIDALPALTIGVIILIRASWAEDRETFKNKPKPISKNREKWTKAESYSNGANESAEPEYAETA
jgi:hypothetical protein